MNSSKLEQELRNFALERKEKEVPAYISKGIDDVLSRLPDGNQYDRKALPKPKQRWLQGLTAAAVLTAGIIGSGFASPAMAKVLTEVPGLSFIFSATYEDISDHKPEQHSMRGSQFGFGEEGPFNSTVTETKMFSGYSEKFDSYIGFSVPKLNSDRDVPSIRVDRYGKNQLQIQTFGEIDNAPVILNVIPNALNLPQFEGESEEPIVKGKLDLPGVKAEVLSYTFDNSNKTNYVVWKRNNILFIIASTISEKRLAEVAKEIDKQALNLK